jgi:pimeloyl-ACP methyl ester carboxylesterase
MTVTGTVRCVVAACLLMGHADEQPSATQSEPILQSFVEGHGRTLVLVGGGTQGAAAFAPHAKALADDHTVVRLQTLNIESAEQQRPLPPRYALRTESRGMLRALNGLGIRDPVDVVGWSFGALLALDFALEHPERVRSLVLVEPPAFWIVSEQERPSDPAMKEMIALLAQLDPKVLPTDDQFRRFRCALNDCPADCL